MKPTYSMSCSGFIAFHFIIKLINDDVYIIKSISTLKNWRETTNIYKYELYKISLIQFEIVSKKKLNFFDFLPGKLLFQLDFELPSPFSFPTEQKKINKLYFILRFTLFRNIRCFREKIFFYFN